MGKFLEVVENKQGQCLSTSLRVEFSLDKGLPQSIILNSHITLCSILRGETSINNRMTTKECVCNEICVMHIATLQKKSLEFCHLEIIFRKKAKKKPLLQLHGAKCEKSKNTMHSKIHNIIYSMTILNITSVDPNPRLYQA